MLTEQLLLLDADPSVTPQEELRIRVNLELKGNLALDVPVTRANRRHWQLVWDAQHADPVYS